MFVRVFKEPKAENGPARAGTLTTVLPGIDQMWAHPAAPVPE
jgi:hypothetical protein